MFFHRSNWFFSINCALALLILAGSSPPSPSELKIQDFKMDLSSRRIIRDASWVEVLGNFLNNGQLMLSYTNDISKKSQTEDGIFVRGDGGNFINNGDFVFDSSVSSTRAWLFLD